MIHAETMVTIIDVNKFSEPVTICGISLGAVLALNYCIYHAEQVQSLILIAPQYKMPRLLLKFQSILFRIMPEKSFLGSMKLFRSNLRGIALTHVKKLHSFSALYLHVFYGCF